MLKKITFITILSLLCSSFIYLTNAQGVWTNRSSLPEGIASAGVAEMNGNIYVAGGYNGSVHLGTLYKYDPVNNTWSSISGLNVPRYGLGLASVNNKLYAIGGVAATGKYQAIMEVFDPATNTWNYAASMPTARRYCAVASLLGKIYCVGGQDTVGADGWYSNKVEEFNPANNTWVTRTPLPVHLYGASAVGLNGKLYVMGGCVDNDGGPLHNAKNLAFVYDPATNQWVRLADMALSGLHCASAALDGKIYAVGGLYSQNGLNKVEVYNTSSDSWSSSIGMSTARFNHGVAVVNNRLFAIGGAASVLNQWPLSTVEMYSLNVNHPPIIICPSRLSVKIGNSCNFNIETEDSEGNSVTLTASNVPYGAQFTVTNGDGNFYWHPNHTGTYEVIFTASDGSAAVSTTTRIVVYQHSGGGWGEIPGPSPVYPPSEVQ